MRTIDWYFDFLSPFAYLGFKQLGSLPDGISVNHIPILFPGVLQHHGNKGPVEIPQKRIFAYRQAIWLAREAGIDFRLPPKHPFPPFPPLRLAVALDSDPAAIETIFDHIWGEGEDVGDPSGWKRLTEKLGVSDADALIGAPQVKDRLRRNTDGAIQLGIFGVPTSVIDNQFFWGQDSASMLLAYLDDPEMFSDFPPSRCPPQQARPAA